MNSPIKAITFDIWDTILIDDSDEPKREKRGLLSKPDERRERLYQFLRREGTISREEVDTAFNVSDAAFRQVWYEQHVTWSVAERLSVILKGLRRELPVAELADLVKGYEEMELAIQPDLAPGIAESVKRLSKRYKLGIISDTIFSSGRVLRKILADHDLERCFDSFVFSDEAGRAKPDRLVFEKAASDLGVDLSEIVHIGDREEKDVEGPHQVGARAIYTTVVLDRGPTATADAVCRDYDELESIIDNL
jgi:putative hydrolase of the HAD superfamily